MTAGAVALRGPLRGHLGVTENGGAPFQRKAHML
jgi:hypothetical protein